MRIRLKYEDRLVLFFLAGVAFGTAAINMMSVPAREEAGYAGRLFAAASQLEYGYGKGYLIAVSRQRILEAAILWFTSITVFSETGFHLAAFYGGFSSSAVLSVMVCQKGIFGPFFYLAAIFPQYLFYIPAWLLAAAAGERYRNRFQVKMALVSLLLLGIGIGAEVFLNPFFVRNIMKSG